MDPSRPRRCSPSIVIVMCGVVAALVALTGYPEHHTRLRAFSMGGAFADSPGIVVNHVSDERARSWVDPQSGVDRTCRSVWVLAGHLHR